VATSGAGDDLPTDDASRDGPGDAPPPSEVSRRDLLRAASVGGAAMLGGVVLGRGTVLAAGGEGNAHAGYEHRTSVAGAGGQVEAVRHGPYGHGVVPPPGLGDGALDAVTVPPPFDGRSGAVRDHELVVTERSLEVADGVVAEAWTYGDTVPGPILRATEGDILRIALTNRTSHPHNLHLHGRHAPGMDGWEPIAPGASFTYEVVAGPVGVHPYHCHTAPLAEHVARGLYGAFIVDPVGGRPPAHEFVLVLGGWDLEDRERIDLACWNGVAGYFATYPLKVPVGERVRCYIVNMLEHEPVGSFHLHAQTFDVFRSGTSLEPDEHTDTITLGQGERAIVEFELPEPGRYMFHPHQHRLAERGAMGWFAAI
jgi:nitrite reductase (NO-forming)